MAFEEQVKTAMETSMYVHESEGARIVMSHENGFKTSAYITHTIVGFLGGGANGPF